MILDEEKYWSKEMVSMHAGVSLDVVELAVKAKALYERDGKIYHDKRLVKFIRSKGNIHLTEVARGRSEIYGVLARRIRKGLMITRAKTACGVIFIVNHRGERTLFYNRENPEKAFDASVAYANKTQKIIKTKKKKAVSKKTKEKPKKQYKYPYLSIAECISLLEILPLTDKWYYVRQKLLRVAKYYYPDLFNKGGK